MQGLNPSFEDMHSNASFERGPNLHWPSPRTMVRIVVFAGQNAPARQLSHTMEDELGEGSK